MVGRSAFPILHCVIILPFWSHEFPFEYFGKTFRFVFLGLIRHDKPKHVYSPKNALFAIDGTVCSILCDDLLRDDDNYKLACHSLTLLTH